MEKILKKEIGFDPIQIKQEFLKELLRVRYQTTLNVKKMKQDLLDKDALMRNRNIPYSERKTDFGKLVKCDQYIDWLNALNFNHSLINEFAVENNDEQNLHYKIKTEALHCFYEYVLYTSYPQLMFDK